MLIKVVCKLESELCTINKYAVCKWRFSYYVMMTSLSYCISNINIIATKVARK